MKIAYTSDLHTDYSDQNVELVPYLANRISEIAPDVFILAGDISSQRGILAETLAGFSELACAKLFVPGNHDVWYDSKRQLQLGFDSTKKYYDLLPLLCEDYGFIPIWVRPYSVGDCGFVGSIGWYDYSFRNPKFDDEISPQMYAEGRYGRSVWVDTRRAWWLREPVDKRRRMIRNRDCKTDRRVCTEMVESIRESLQCLPDDSIRRIIGVVHVVPFRQMVRHINDLSWDFFAAFMGSERLGAALGEDPRVSHVVCGHLHRKRTHDIAGIQVMSSPVGYPDEWISTDYRTVAEDSIGILDLK